jgi:hypothetical protein
MSVDRALKEMIADEVERAIRPLAAAIDDLRSGGNVAAQVAALLTGGRRGPGRPPKLAALAARVRPGRKPGRKAGPKKGCAIKGCKNPMRSKGYCSAHYQKYRMLERTKRLPADWKEYAAVGTVKDIKLPRGRAGARALAELRAYGEPARLGARGSRRARARPPAP